MLVGDVLFDNGCSDAGPLLDCCGNDGRITLDPPNVLRSNVGYVQLHCLDAEFRGPFQNNGAADDFANRGILCDAHNVFHPSSVVSS